MSANSIYSNLSKMYVSLKDMFGESGRYYDRWKCSFSFPFLISFQKGEEEFNYLMYVIDVRATIKFEMAKLIYVDDKKFDRYKLYESFDDFPTEEINAVIDYFVEFLTVHFTSIQASYDEFFYHIVGSEHIVYGYKEGVFFEKKYEAEDDLENLIHQL